MSVPTDEGRPAIERGAERLSVVVPGDLSVVEAKLAETVLRGVSGALVAGFAVARLVGLSRVVKGGAPARVAEGGGS